MKYLKLFESKNKELDMVFIQYLNNGKEATYIGDVDALTIYIDGELFIHRFDDIESYQVLDGINAILKYLNIKCKKEVILLKDTKIINSYFKNKQPPKYLDALLMSTNSWERVTPKK